MNIDCMHLYNFTVTSDEFVDDEDRYPTRTLYVTSSSFAIALALSLI